MTALILRRPLEQTGPVTFDNISEFLVEENSGAIAERNELLERSREVEQVTTPKAYELAIGLIKSLKGLLKSTEDLRKQVKAPVRGLGEKIDAIASKFGSPVDVELKRLQNEADRWARRLEVERIEAERKRNEELARLERERKALEQRAAVSTDTKEISKLQTQQKQIHAAESQALITKEQPKVAGTAPTKVPKFELLDIRALYKARPDLCNIEPATNKINAAIRANLEEMQKCPGLSNVRMELEVRTRA